MNGSEVSRTRVIGYSYRSINNSQTLRPGGLLYLDNPKALGCSVPSAARTLLRAKGEYSRPHWSRCLTDLEHSNALPL